MIPRHRRDLGSARALLAVERVFTQHVDEIETLVRGEVEERSAVAERVTVRGRVDVVVGRVRVLEGVRLLGDDLHQSEKA